MFHCTIQLAGYDFEQVDDAGIVNQDSFFSILDDFNWPDQVKKYDEIRQGCSPTISATNQDDDRSLWISAYSSPGKINFLIGYVYYKNVKKLFGLGKTETKKWVDIYLISDDPTAKDFFQLFFTKNYPELEKTLSLEKLMDSMPSKK
jgi:hypothetical protein